MASGCESCPPFDDFTPHLCFKLPDYEGLCAGFSEEDTHFVLFNENQKKRRKKQKKVLYGWGDRTHLLTLATDKRLALTAIEILFIQDALEFFKLESRKIGYTYTESGLGIKIMKEGEGEKNLPGEVVSVHYVVYLLDGTKIDSSYDRGEPFRFTLGKGEVIKGWDEGIAALNIGTKAWLYIPYKLGYGDRGKPPIPPNSDLIFQVEVTRP